MDTDVESCLKDWNDLAKDYKELEILNREYLAKLEEVSELQAKCLKGISHQRYRMGVISKSLKQLHASETKKGLDKEMARREEQLHEIEQTLPKSNGTYLQIILGSVNVSILNKSDKFKYKDEYEKFKLILSVIGFILSVLNLLTDIRTLELSFMFLLVWYYCTLTIRESILKVNGSKIKGWWRFHHFLSTVVSGVLLVWPNTGPWYAFRQQFMWFNVYISVVQYLQFCYQRGVLYRLKALGERHNMDITIEGFHSWMWRGLSFLLPFLFAGYLFQLYNAYVLYTLISHPEATWHVPVLSAMFLVLFLGNIITTIMVIPQKLRQRVKDHFPGVFTSKPEQKKEVNGEKNVKAQKSRNIITTDISNEELRKEIADILEDADLTVMTVKKIRLQIEGKFDIDLTSRRLEVDKLVMECLRGKQDEAKKTASKESKDGEEEEEDGFEKEEEEIYEEEEEEGYEEEKKPLKRSTAKKAVNKCKRRSSDEEETASDDDASDEEYSSRKPKATPKKTGKLKKISNDELFDEITDILEDADLSTLTTKKIILQIEGKFDIDLSEREWEVDKIVLECLPINQDGIKKKKADISNEELRKEIIAILKDADLTTMSAKKLRLQIEEKFDMDFFHRKVELDKIAMEYLREKQDGAKKKKTASKESEDGEEEKKPCKESSK